MINLPDKKECVHRKCRVAHCLEHEVSLGQCSQRFVFCITYYGVSIYNYYYLKFETSKLTSNRKHLQVRMDHYDPSQTQKS